MAAITWAAVEDLAPELSTVNADAQTEILNFVNDAFDPAALGGEASYRLRMARIYYAAHFGTVTAQGSSGAAGPVIGESAGGLSRQYASFSPAGSDPLLDSTPYGKQLRLIIRNSPARGPLVI